VAKSELGTKRLCAGCGAKFYDLGKTPIVCPKCGTTFEVTVMPSRSRPDAAAAARAPAVAPREAEAAELPETQDAEFVSLEEADAEAQGGAKKAPAGEAGEPEEEDVEIDDESLDDAAFIQEQEEEDTDVTEIIGGDIEDKDET
jgi:uncharacterized protein (TIGR02300 family)